MLPKVIYVYEEKSMDGSMYFVADKTPDGLDEGLIGVYDLRETLHVSHPLEFRRPGTKGWFKSTRK